MKRWFKRRKVFCVGYNKTGTTTLQSVLRDLGYRMPSQSRQEALVVEKMMQGDYTPLRALCRRYDAFQDMPFSQGAIYAVVDALFPGSRFILTVRDSGEWFDSLVRFHLAGVLKLAGVQAIEDFGEDSFRNKAPYLHENYMYRLAKRHAVTADGCETGLDWALVYDRAHRINAYNSRNREILSHFQGRPNQLLVLDLSEERDNSKIVEFLELPSSMIAPLPHLNRSA